MPGVGGRGTGWGLGGDKVGTREKKSGSPPSPAEEEDETDWRKV